MFEKKPAVLQEADWVSAILQLGAVLTAVNKPGKLL